MLQFLSENIYEICLGIAVILSNLSGKNKNLTIEEIKQKKLNKKRISISKKGAKATKKALKYETKLKNLPENKSETEE